MYLELKLEGLDEANDVIVNRLIKEHDHGIAKYKKAKKDKDFAIRLDEAVKNVLSAKSAIFEIDKSSTTKEAFDEKLFNELKEKGDKIVKSMF